MGAMKHATGCANRVFLYTQIGAKEGEGHAKAELNILREEAARRKLDIIDMAADLMTGSPADRPQGLIKALEMAHHHQLDFIAVERLSRLTVRGPAEALQLVHTFNLRGCRIISTSEPLFDGQVYQVHRARTFKTVLAIAEYIATEQYRIRGERTRAGQRRAVAEGKKLGGPRIPYDAAKFEQLRASGHNLEQLAKACGLTKGTAYRRLIEYEAVRKAKTAPERTV